LAGAGSLAGRGVLVGDQVTRQSTLQDALEAILTEGGAAVVTKGRGEYDGIVNIDTVMHVVRQLRDEHGGAEQHGGGAARPEFESTS
jgi:osmoprotectant transport system ATP-binding protein